MKIRKKVLSVAVAVIVFLSLTASPLMIEATRAQDDNIVVTVNASRPLLTGAPRGTATVTTRNSGSQAIRVRTIVTNSNNTVTAPLDWQQTSAAGNATLVTGTSRTSAQTIGSTRSGTVEGQGQRRATATGAWSVAVRPIHPF